MGDSTTAFLGGYYGGEAKIPSYSRPKTGGKKKTRKPSMKTELKRKLQARKKVLKTELRQVERDLKSLSCHRRK